MSDSLLSFTADDVPGLSSAAAAPGVSSADPALFQKLLLQESGGRQFKADGTPVTSRKGAIGIAQVMPETGPEAAKLAGLPWDDVKFRTDAAYNKALGNAYFNKQLEDFGDVGHALAAYNAGPGAMRRALATATQKGDPKNYLQYLPPETRAYVPAILKQYGVTSSEQAAGGAQAQQGQDYYQPNQTQYADIAAPMVGPSVGDYFKQVAASAVESVGSIGQAAGEVGAAVANKVTGSQDYEGKNVLAPASEAVRSSMTAGGKAAMSDAPQGDILDPSSWKMPETVPGVLMAGAQGLGSMLPMLLVTLVPGLGEVAIAKRAQVAAEALKVATAAGDAGKIAEATSALSEAQAAAKAAALKTKVLGGGSEAAMTGGAAAGDVRQSAAKTVAGMTHEQLLQVPAYEQEFAKSGDEQQARQAVVNSAAQWAGALSAVAGAGQGVFNAKIIEDALMHKGVMSALGGLSNSRIVRAGAGATAGHFIEGGQEAMEKIGQNAGENIGLGRSVGDNVTRDTVGDFVGGAIVGSAGGAVAGAVSSHHVDPAVQRVQAAADAGGVLSKAAIAGNQSPAGQADIAGKAAAVQEQQQAETTAAAEAAKDPLAAQVKQLEATIRQEGALDALRAEHSPVDAKKVLHDLAIAKSQSTSMAQREQAVNRLEQALAWAGVNPAPQVASGIEQIVGPVTEGREQKPAPDLATKQAAVARDSELQAQAKGTPAVTPRASVMGRAQQLEEAAADIESDPKAPPEQLRRADQMRQEAKGLRADEERRARAAQPGALTEFDRRSATEQAAVARERRLNAPAAEPTAAAPKAETLKPEEQQRLEAAALAGKQQQRKAEDDPRQVIVTRAMKNIEERKGVASPQEAQILAEAGLGKPYDRIDTSLAPQPSMDQKLTQATGIALDKAPREDAVQSKPADTRQADEERARGESRMAAQERTAQARQRGTEAMHDVASKTAAKPADKPAAAKVIEAMKAVAALRNAEQVAVLRAARQHYSAEDMAILSNAAHAPALLTATDKQRLDALRSAPREESTAREGAPATEPNVGVTAPKVGTPAGAGPAVFRKRRATLRQIVDMGLNRVERRADGFFLTDGKRDFKLEGPADAQLARQEVSAHIHEKTSRATGDTASNAQVDAENYRKGEPVTLYPRVTFIAEHGKGQKRFDRKNTPPKWEQILNHPYGDIEDSLGADGDRVDAFVVGDGNRIFVIDQVNQDGSFDEHKVMLRARDERSARAAYLSNYEPGWRGLGDITEMTPEQFATWVHDRKATQKAVGDLSGETRHADNADAGERDGAERADAAGGVDDRVVRDRAPDDRAGDGAAGESGAGNAPTAAASAGGARSHVTVQVEGQKRSVPIVDITELDGESTARGGNRFALKRAHADLLKTIASAFGKQVFFFDDVSLGDGFVQPGDNSTIFIGTHTTINPLAVLGHEMWHMIRRENPDAWASVAKVVQAQMGENTPKMFRDDYRPDLKATNTNAPLSEHRGGELEELVSDLGGNAFTDPKFWNQVMVEIAATNGEQATPIITRLVALVQQMVARVAAAIKGGKFKADTFVKDLDAVRDALRTGMAQYAQGRGVRLAALQAQVQKTTQELQRSTARAVAGVSIEESSAPIKRTPENQQLLDMVTPPTPRDKVLRAVMDGKLVGYLDLSVGEDGKTAEVRDVKVATAQRRKGIASALYDKARELGYEVKRSQYQTEAGSAFRDAYDGKSSDVQRSAAREKSDDAEHSVGQLGQVDDGVPGEAPSYGRAQAAGAVSVVGRHYGTTPRTHLSGSAYGRGLKGGERERVSQADDKRLRDRIYFYVDQGHGITPEAGVGPFAHETRLNNIYDPATGLVKYKGGMNGFEKAVIDAGYDGYINREFTTKQGAVVLLGPKHKAVPTKFIGTPESAKAAAPDTSKESTRVALMSKEIDTIDTSSIPGAKLRAGTLTVPADSVQQANQELERIGSSIRLSTARTNTDGFDRWFDGSQVRDSDGNPQVVYHGTNADFSEFDEQKLGSSTDHPTAALGFFFSADPDVAMTFTGHYVVGESGKVQHWQPGLGGNIMPAYLSIKKPKVMTASQYRDAIITADGDASTVRNDFTALRKPGVLQRLLGDTYDGVLVKGDPSLPQGDEGSADVWVAFRPNQIKSAIGNDGNYRISEADITRSTARPTDNRHGFAPALLTQAKGKIALPEKTLFTQTTTNGNAERQLEGIDKVLRKFQNPESSENDWNRMMAYALADKQVPVPPYQLIARIGSDAYGEILGGLSAGQVADADHGFENAAAFRKLYEDGVADVVTTGKLALWSFLSRGVSPYVQESLFMDAVSGIEPWIELAARGEFDDKALERYTRWSEGIAGKGSGQPGSGAKHNLNAFGRSYLLNVSRPHESGKPLLQHWHDLVADFDNSGPELRREFAKFGQGVGIDNKVVSFSLLVSGRTDVMVLDRVQIKALWDDGRFADRNLYDGVTGPDGQKLAGTSLADLTSGARGLLTYEAVERAVTRRMGDWFDQAGRPDAASLGRFHWEAWVAYSGQEASHGTIAGIMRDAAGQAKPFEGVTAKEGEYGAYAYGARYGVDETGQPYFLYDHSDGKAFHFSVPAFREFLAQVKKPANKVVPTNFLVSKDEHGNNRTSPWYDDPRVDRARLDRLVEKTGSAQPGERAVRQDGAQPAAHGAGSSVQRSTARDGSRGDESRSLAPLAGAPTVQGASGPDARLVQVAERYARSRGIELGRQSAYVKVDPVRAARIATAYEAMAHAPQDPRVAAAYADLIRQTREQYDALVEDGYKFTFFDSKSDPYQGNPWNAMRDLRANQRMAVYGTYDGYGTAGITKGASDDNPMLADTGLRWPDQAGQDRMVTANDLFRAVHDAFGHGLEGAGFRSDGEENAWQAHQRLFTGPAVGAITSETRGQNSWLNYGPYGERNRTAKLEDTVFADQKTGLMPEWTWTEGVVGSMPAEAVAREAEKPAQSGSVEERVATLRKLLACLKK